MRNDATKDKCHLRRCQEDGERCTDSDSDQARSIDEEKRSQNDSSPDLATQQVVAALVAKLEQQQRDIDRLTEALSSRAFEAPKEAEAALRPEIDAEEACDDSEESVDTVNLGCVVIYKIATANTATKWFFATVWVLVLLAFTVVAVLSLISICIGIAWPRCYGQTCRLGTACVFIHPLGALDVYLQPTCEDCWLLDWHPHALVLDNMPAGGIGFSTENASQVCKQALDRSAPALSSVNWDKCLYVGTKLATMSPQDTIACYIVFLLTAGLITKDAMQHARARQLRQLILPLLPLLRSWASSPRSFAKLGSLCAVVIVKFSEMLLRNMVPPLVIVCLMMLILTQGADSASLLLNGLSVGFFMEIDDLIPQMVLSDAEMARAGAFLTTAAQGATRKDKMFHGRSSITPLVSVTLATWYVVSLVMAFSDAGRHRCEHLLHHYYYRVGLVTGFWIPGATQTVLNFLHGAYAVGLSAASHTATCAVRARQFVPVASRFLVELVEMFFAVWLMNHLYWVSVAILYYDTPWEDAQRLYPQMVNDIFGTCVKGFGEECTDW